MTSADSPVPAENDVGYLFKQAMRRLASGVGVVTAQGESGVTGMAATSITSLTMDPPAVLVCVNRSASLHGCLSTGCAINVNILSRHQREISAAFGGAVPREQRFTVGVWTADHRGLPMLDEAQANLSCVVDAIWSYGTHSIVAARIDAVRLTGDVDPLIYSNGIYV